MKPVMGKVCDWGVSSYSIRFKYYNNNAYPSKLLPFSKTIPSDFLSDDIHILGVNNDTMLPKHIGDMEIAVINPKPNQYHDYVLMYGNIIKKSEQFEEIRKSKNKTIVLIDFRDELAVDQYVACGAMVILI